MKNIESGLWKLIKSTPGLGGTKGKRTLTEKRHKDEGGQKERAGGEQRERE